MYFNLMSSLLYSSMIAILILLLKPLIIKLMEIRIYSFLWGFLLLLLILPSILLGYFFKPIVDLFPPIASSFYSTILYQTNKNFIFQNNFLFFKIIWIIGIVFLIIKTIMKRNKCKKLFFILKDNNEVIQKEMLKLKMELNIKKNIPIYTNDLISTPIIIGVLQPKIILPKNILSILKKKDLYFILKHELIHFIRKDNFKKTILHVLKTIFWWNPLVYLICHNIEESLEYSCDDLVLKNSTKKERFHYSTLIVNITEKQMDKIAIFSAFLTPNKLKRRIELIMNKKAKKTFLCLSIVGVLSLGIMATTFAIQSNQENENQNIYKIINQEKFDEATQNNQLSYKASDVKINPVTGKYELFFDNEVIIEYNFDPIEDFKNTLIDTDQEYLLDDMDNFILTTVPMPSIK